MTIALAPVFAGSAQAATYAGLVIDAKNGKVLYAHRGDARHYPASLTKMMTLYLMFEALESGRLSKSSRIVFSEAAAAKPPSKLGVPAGRSISAEQAILALVTKSANDVAAAVAENLGQTESGFAAMMTRKARQLGMNSTTFRNASGLPDDGQVTTARDMARLGVALQEHFPQHFHYFSTRSFRYGKARMGNHNRLLGKVKGVDGIKTGYIRASGFNLVTSVNTDGRSIVAVVLGGRTGASRNAQMAKLIKQYLYKASKGADRDIVARSGSAFSVASLVLPDEGPLPSFRRGGIDPASMRVAVAHQMSEMVIPIPGREYRDAGFDIAAVARRLREIGAAKMPVPSQAPETAPEIALAANDADPMLTAEVGPVGSRLSEEPPTQSIEPLSHMMAFAEPEREADDAQSERRSGWQVQISAVPDRRAALAILEKTRVSAPDILESFDNYTETVEKNGIILHRARFAGFDSKTQARQTCSQLKRKKIRCLAVHNDG